MYTHSPYRPTFEHVQLALFELGVAIPGFRYEGYFRAFRNVEIGGRDPGVMKYNFLAFFLNPTNG